MRFEEPSIFTTTINKHETLDESNSITFSPCRLSPEIYMKRPITEGDKWRLDVILKRKAVSFNALNMHHAQLYLSVEKLISPLSHWVLSC